MSPLNRKIAIVLVTIGLTGAAGAQTAVKISDILRAPRDYAEHDVAVFGHVRELTMRPHYDTFKICEARCLNVLAWGPPRIANGQALSVRGRFHLIKIIEHRRVHHVIEVEHGTL
jgi:hypothetical protein